MIVKTKLSIAKEYIALNLLGFLHIEVVMGVGQPFLSPAGQAIEPAHKSCVCYYINS